MEEILPGDLAGIYKEIAEQIGVEHTKKLYEHFKGQQLSLPLKFFDNKYVTQKANVAYQEGIKIRNIAREYGYTERRVRQMIKRDEIV